MSDTGYQPYCEKCGAPVVWCTCLDDTDWSPEMRSYLGRVRLEQQVKELRVELARRDEIIARLKEDGERMANSDYRLPSGVTKCPYCSKADWTIRPDGKSTEIHHSPDCPITLHRALIAELEKETEK